MIKIAICDDEGQAREQTHHMLTQYNALHPQFKLSINLFTSPLALLSHIEEKGTFDIYLLDVYMNGLTGTDMAKQLRQKGDEGEIIFLTSSREHALEAYGVEAAQYLLKPILESSFFSILDKLFEQLDVERRHIITLKTTDGIIRLFSRNVLYAETGRNNYQVIHTLFDDQIEVRMTSSELYDLLVPTKIFVRCGASLIVNLKQVRTINKDTIVFDTGKRMHYPYRAYQKLRADFLSLQMEIE